MSEAHGGIESGLFKVELGGPSSGALLKGEIGRS